MSASAARGSYTLTHSDDASVSLYDLAVDKKTGIIYIVDKAGKIITETVYKTK